MYEKQGSNFVKTRSKICQLVPYRTLWYPPRNISPLTRQDFIFQLWMPFCHAERGRWYVCSMNRWRERRNRADTQKKREHSQRKFWLVYADSPVKILPGLLLWGLLWTLPAPSGSYQRSHVFLARSPSAFVFLRHSSYTHPGFEEKMYTVTVGLQPLCDWQRQTSPRKRQSICCTAAELGLRFSKLNLKSLFTFIIITQISIYMRALLLDQHSTQLWELHCQALPSRAAV